MVFLSSARSLPASSIAWDVQDRLLRSKVTQVVLMASSMTTSGAKNAWKSNWIS